MFLFSSAAFCHRKCRAFLVGKFFLEEMEVPTDTFGDRGFPDAEILNSNRGFGIFPHYRRNPGSSSGSGIRTARGFLGAIFAQEDLVTRKISCVTCST